MKPIPVSFNIWKLKVHTYGIGLAITFWFAFRYFERRLRDRGYPWQWLAGAFVWIIVAAIIGARAVHVLANLSYYEADPGQILAIWNGGLSSFGGLIGGIPTGLILARKRCPTLPTIKALDIVAPVLMAAWGVGRLLGPQLMVAGGGHPTSQWFGMYYAGEAGKRLPVPIFQSIESFAIWGILILIERRLPNRPTGFILAATMGLWGLSRFAEEHLWLSDTSHVGSFLVQAAGLALCAAGIVTMAVLWRKSRKNPQTDASLPGPDTAGSTVDGGTVDGGTVDGGTVDGGTVDGDTVDGDTVDGDTVDGDTVDGDESQILHAGVGELETAGAVVEPSGPASPAG